MGALLDHPAPCPLWSQAPLNTFELCCLVHFTAHFLSKNVKGTNLQTQIRQVSPLISIEIAILNESPDFILS